MAIKRIEREHLLGMQDIVETALNNIRTEYGVDVEITKIKCDNGLDFHMILVGNTTEDRTLAEKEGFASQSYMYGLSPDDYEKSFIENGKTYKIFGIKPRNRKYPVLARNGKGTVYKFSASKVQLALGRKE